MPDDNAAVDPAEGRRGPLSSAFPKPLIHLFLFRFFFVFYDSRLSK